MTSYISHTTIDCDNDPNEPGDEECMIRDPETGHQLLFIEVLDEKSVKNRIHLDLRPRTGTRDEELARLLELGAREVADLRGKYGPGTAWVVLADPEGNEFCILRSEAEMSARP